MPSHHLRCLSLVGVLTALAACDSSPSQHSSTEWELVTSVETTSAQTHSDTLMLIE